MEFVSLVLIAMGVTSSSSPFVQIRREHSMPHANPIAVQVKGKAELCYHTPETVQAAQV